MTPSFHVATRKGLFTFTLSSDQWQLSQTSFLGDNCSMILNDPRPCDIKTDAGVQSSTETLYAALDHGHFGVKLHRSIDQGKSWNEIAVPVYPPKPKSETPEKPPAEGVAYDWSLTLIWELVAGGKDEPGKLWCGTLPGGLFSSEDAGNTWQLNEGLWHHPSREEWFGGGMDVPGMHSICVHPDNPKHLLTAISCGGVWESLDGGNTWKAKCQGMRADYMPPERAFDPVIQDPHRLVQCPASPEHLWVQHHNGIFRSTNFGETWTEIENVTPSSFGFAVAVHPKDPDTAWFVPAIKDEHRIPEHGKIIVNRTQDGGKTFTNLTQGLPQEHAYDIVYRHALDVDATGNYLVFGSTTGSLWVSSDGGDTWQSLSHHLPPIYAVRFKK